MFHAPFVRRPAHLSAGRQQVHEADVVPQVVEGVSPGGRPPRHQHLLPHLGRLVEDVGEARVVLHHELHHVRLVAFERQAEAVDAHDRVEQVEVLRRLVLVLRRQLDDRLDLRRQDLQARHLVAEKRLAQQRRSL